MMCEKYLDCKKAVKSAIVLYALIFTFASALMFYVPPAAFNYAALVVAAAFVFVVSKHYFRMYKPVNPLYSGLTLGLVYAVVMFVLDVLLMVYGFAASVGWAYFSSTSQMLGYALTIVIPVLAAKFVWGKRAGVARRSRRR